MLFSVYTSPSSHSSSHFMICLPSLVWFQVALPLTFISLLFCFLLLQRPFLHFRQRNEIWEQNAAPIRVGNVWARGETLENISVENFLVGESFAMRKFSEMQSFRLRKQICHRVSSSLATHSPLRFVFLVKIKLVECFGERNKPFIFSFIKGRASQS